MALDADVPDPRISNSASQIPAKSVASVPYLDFRNITAMMAAVGEVFFGKVTGTGVALPVTGLPFDPAAVLVVNETQLASFEKWPSMPAGDTFKRVTAGTMSKIATTAGITLGAKGERKFTIGTDAALNTAADVIHFVAIGSRGLGGSL